MQIGELAQLIAEHPELDVLATEFSKKCEKHFLLRNLYASSQGIILSSLHQRLQTTNPSSSLLIVLEDADSAQYMYADLRTLRDGKDVYFFPSSHRRRQKTDEALVVQRTEVLGELLSPHNGVMIVTYPEALMDAVPLPTALQQQTISLTTGEEIAQSNVIQQLIEHQFQRVDFVYEPGQFAVRGGILDVYSYAYDNPYRIDFFGDEVDSIREFDIETQLSQHRLNSVNIVAHASSESTTASLMDYLDPATIWVSNDFELAQYKMGEKLTEKLSEEKTIELGKRSSFPT